VDGHRRLDCDLYAVEGCDAANEGLAFDAIRALNGFCTLLSHIRALG
jgi:hypothetical protein